MAFTKFLQKLTYFILGFFLFYSLAFHVVNAEDESLKKNESEPNSVMVTIDEQDEPLETNESERNPITIKIDEPINDEAFNYEIITARGMVDDHDAAIKLFLMNSQ